MGKALLLAMLALPLLSSTGCVLVSYRVEVQPMDRPDGLAITTPVRVHLADGSTGIYAEGLTVRRGSLFGRGLYYDLGFQPLRNNPLFLVPVASVTGMETFHGKVNRGKTLALLPVSIPLSVIAVGARGGGGGFRTGATLDNFPPLITGRGVTALIQTGQRKLIGELIDIRDDGIVILDHKLRLVPYNAIVKADFERVQSRYALRNQRAPEPGVREHLRLVSRFPQTLPPALLQQFLTVQKQTRLASIDD